MGGCLTCICCMCCLGTQKASCIDISILIGTIIHLGCHIWGLIGIPWKYVKTAAKVLFIISLVISIINLVSIIYLIYLRRKNLINNIKNKIAKIIGIIILVINIIGFILIIIAEYMIGRDMDKADERNYFKVISDSEWAAAYVSTSIIELLYIILGYFWSALRNLISARIEGPYFDYLRKNLRGNVPDNSTTAYVIGNNNQATNLQLVGYDQNGNPIYSQQNGNFTVQQTNTNNNAFNP